MRSTYRKIRDIVVLVQRRRSFFFLWCSQLFSQLATHMLHFTLAVQIDRLTDSATSFSLLFMVVGIPAVFIGSFAGVISDRVDKRRILAITNASRTLLSLLFLWIDHSFVLILVLIFIISVVMQFFVPAETALIPKLVGRNGLLIANGLFTFTFFGTLVAGYVSASYIITALALSRLTLLYVLISVLFFISFLANKAILCTVSGKIENNAEDGVIHPSSFVGVFEEMKEGFVYSFRSPIRRVSLCHLMLITALFSIILVLTPTIARIVFSVQLEEFAMPVFSVYAIGIAVAFPFVRRVVRKFSYFLTIEWGFILVGLLLVASTALSVFPFLGLPFVLCIVFALGVLNILISVPAQTLLQKNTEEHNRGKVFGIMNMFYNAMSAFPVIFIGVLVDWVGVFATLFMVGVLYVLYGVYSIVMHSRIPPSLEVE